MVSVEALIRWHHAERGIVHPSEFVPIAEENGLIRPLGRWILREACAQKAAWDRQGFSFKVAVNVSPAETAYDDYPEFLAGVLGDAGLAGDGIELEITEGLLIEHEHPSVRNFFAFCEQWGIGLAIDDFGTGYSSLGYLKRLPVSKIKIDRSFVQTLGKPDGDAFVAALVAVGHSPDKRIVAEGIEDASQLNALERLGCHEGQGYFLSPPVGAESLRQRLEEAFV
jgi:EAL domain-containing protein (putative c-di-GMP-specific phosphodiesterase class I)